MSSRIEWQEFTDEDRSVFTGAEAFDDGRAPLIGSLFVGGRAGVAVVTAHGVTIYLGADDCETAGLQREGADQDGAIAHVLAFLPMYTDADTLRAFGFTVIT